MRLIMNALPTKRPTFASENWNHADGIYWIAAVRLSIFSFRSHLNASNGFFTSFRSKYKSKTGQMWLPVFPHSLFSLPSHILPNDQLICFFLFKISFILHDFFIVIKNEKKVSLIKKWKYWFVMINFKFCFKIDLDLYIIEVML